MVHRLVHYREEALQALHHQLSSMVPQAAAEFQPPPLTNAAASPVCRGPLSTVPCLSSSAKSQRLLPQVCPGRPSLPTQGNWGAPSKASRTGRSILCRRRTLDRAFSRPHRCRAPHLLPGIPYLPNRITNSVLPPMALWCSGRMLASHARGPGFNPRAG